MPLFFIQDPPPPAVATEQAQSPPSAPEGPARIDDVVVVAERPAAVNQIDRRIYDVSRDAIVQTLPAADILTRIPSVSADANGRLRLLGQPGVSLLIDGQRPVSEQALLRTLTGSDIDRIEVLTNPGVQYGPTATGGVINIITSRPTRPGLSGPATVSADSSGSTQLSVSPSLVAGRWTFSGGLNLSDQNLEDRSLFRRSVAGASPAADVQDEQREGDVESVSLSGRLKMAYKRSDRHDLSLGLEALSSDQDADRLGRFLADGSNLIAIERGREDSHVDSAALTASSLWRRPREGEEWNATLRLDRLSGQNQYAFETEQAVAPFGISAFRTSRRSGIDNQSVKLDYKRPFGDEHLLTAGAAWERSDQTFDSVVSDPDAAPPAVASQIASTRQIASAYGTVQTTWGDFTLLPGLRLERQALRIAGVPGQIDSTDLYPSLHLRWSVDDGLDLDLSYAKRIDRPDASSLDPTPIFSRALEATRGNPSLRPQTLHALEARLTFSRSGHTLTATAYDRERRDLWTSFRERGADGIIVSYPINAGDGWDRGLEISVRGRLASRLTYAATANVFASSRNVLEADGPDVSTTVRYLSNGQIEYTAPERNGLPGDRLQLSFTFTGPERTLQTEYASAFNANLSWSHALTRRVTGVLTVRNVFNSNGARWATRGPDFWEDARFDSSGIQARIGLTYRFGAGTR